MEPESALLVRESLTRYPFANAFWAGIDTVLQFFAYPTGDGIVPQEWCSIPSSAVPSPSRWTATATPISSAASSGSCRSNLLHVPVALFSVVMLYIFLRRAVRARDWKEASLPAFVLLALLGNAFICGVFSGPHYRYQSRMMWWPALAVVLIGGARIPALRQRFSPDDQDV